MKATKTITEFAGELIEAIKTIIPDMDDAYCRKPRISPLTTCTS